MESHGNVKGELTCEDHRGDEDAAKDHSTKRKGEELKNQDDKGRQFIHILGELKAQREQSQESINMMSKAEPEMHGSWEKIRAVIDSGANAPVMPPAFGKAYPVQESPGSRSGDAYMAANGGIIPNLGQKLLPIVTKEGHIKSYMSQCADVTTTLQSVLHLNRTGHGVWLDGHESCVIDKSTGEVSQVDFDGKNFTMDMWVIPPEDLNVLMSPDHHAADAASGFTRHHP